MSGKTREQGIPPRPPKTWRRPERRRRRRMPPPRATPALPRAGAPRASVPPVTTGSRAGSAPRPPAGSGSGAGHSSVVNERPAQVVSPKEVRVGRGCLETCRVSRFSPMTGGTASSRCCRPRTGSGAGRCATTDRWSRASPTGTAAGLPGRTCRRRSVRGRGCGNPTAASAGTGPGTRIHKMLLAEADAPDRFSGTSRGLDDQPCPPACHESSPRQGAAELHETAGGAR